MSHRSKKEESTKSKVLKILDLERKNGFNDEAVFGGLESLSETLLDDSEIEETLKGYGDKDPYEREEVVEEARNLLASESDEGHREKRETPGLSAPVTEAVGVGDKRARDLENLGIKTIRDLLFHFPRRIEDRRKVKKIGELNHGEEFTVVGAVEGTTMIQPHRNLKLVKAAISDGTGTLYGIWYNQPWINNQLKKGEKVAVYGETKREYGELQMENPVWEPANRENKTRALVPIYPATENLSQSKIRWIIRKNLTALPRSISEFYPEEVAGKYGFWDRRTALEKIHSPDSPEDYNKARRSLSFSELYLFYYGMKTRTAGREDPELAMEVDGETLGEFLEAIPFTLTGDQERTLGEVVDDLRGPSPMNRLLQGDVGTGKTLIAAGSAFLVKKGGYQTALMAPTTVLAEQHYENLSQVFSPLRMDVDLLTGNTSARDRDELLSSLESGDIDVLVGTHALLEGGVRFHDLGLVIIDEEQRFGVAQKEKLNADYRPVNRLILSATPIPRTITSTIYGEFDISRLEEFPGGEKKIKTYWVSDSRRDQVYEYVRRKLNEGDRGVIVFPLIEESEKVDSKAAVEMQKELSGNQLKGLRLGLLHGQMGQEEKAEIIERFREGELDAIVSTTVIEVGIDIPQANILVVDEADHFGLTQLHQLRGRIGRSGQKSYCFAIGSPSTEEGRRRLGAFRDILDGFALVEEDLKIRGPGDLLSSSQHGFQNSFYACDFLNDYDIMNKARKEAGKLVEECGADERLDKLLDEYFMDAPWKYN
ncbi:MAG: ATP-dependent DNA helicase RecG [Candidatus Acetothermia bacterium]